MAIVATVFPSVRACVLSNNYFIYSTSRDLKSEGVLRFYTCKLQLIYVWAMARHLPILSYVVSKRGRKELVFFEGVPRRRCSCCRLDICRMWKQSMMKKILSEA